jgi:hypothetical protein
MKMMNRCHTEITKRRVGFYFRLEVETQSAAILVTAAAGTNEETVTLPDFTMEFPKVFPEGNRKDYHHYEKDATTK